MAIGVKIAVIGTQRGVQAVIENAIYSESISKVFVWNYDFFVNESPDFVEGFDIIVVAFEDNSFANTVFNALIELRKDNPALLFDFYRMQRVLAPLMKADFVMQNPAYQQFGGLILGLSHSEVGIIPERLGGGPFANLSVSSQDIYLNYKTLEYCMTKYPEKLLGVSKVILEMFDYSYFNYDLSMVKTFCNYLYWGGFNKSPHNLRYNESYSQHELSDMVQAVIDLRFDGIDEDRIEIWRKLFKTDWKCLYDTKYLFPWLFPYRNEHMDERKVSDFKVGNFVNQRFEDTLAENKDLFEKLLKCCYQINQDMKIYVLLMPRYAGVWDKEALILDNWKDYFYSVMAEFRNSYDFAILDYTRDTIAGNKYFYYDASHLNCFGAMKFTEMLNEEIK